MRNLKCSDFDSNPPVRASSDATEMLHHRCAAALGMARHILSCMGLQACEAAVHQELENMGAANKSSLAELLLSFFLMYATACEEWLCASNVGFRWAAVPAGMHVSCVTCTLDHAPKPGTINVGS